MHEAHSRPNLARKLCVPVLNSRTATQNFQPVFTEFFRIVCYYKKSANQTANGCFCCKIRSAIWGIPDSEQLGTDTIWGYPEYGASVRHVVSPGLNGLKFKDDSLLAWKYKVFARDVMKF